MSDEESSEDAADGSLFEVAEPTNRSSDKLTYRGEEES